MPNSWFKFKQFTIEQDKCAMKVCTDACILGAWAAQKVTESCMEIKNILDIGTGTGILSLMMAQKTNALIDAIEINADAAMQAKENTLRSPWKDRIKIFHTSLEDFKPLHKYDLVISNPPFYENDLKAGSDSKNAAKHDSGLKFDELLFFTREYLNIDGVAIILIPFHRMEYVEKLTEENNLFIRKTLFIKQTPSHNFFRSGLFLSPDNSQNSETEELVIHDSDRNYTPEFKAWMKDYYLSF